MLSEQAAALAAAGSAFGVVGVVVALLVARGAPHPSGELSGRGRFPARGLERAVLAGVAAIALAGISAWNLDAEVQIGVAALVVGLLWMWWRGSFMALADRTPARESSGHSARMREPRG